MQQVAQTEGTASTTEEPEPQWMLMIRVSEEIDENDDDEGVDIEFAVDCGSEVHALTAQHAEPWSGDVEPRALGVRNADGTVIRHFGHVLMLVKFVRFIFQIDFEVAQIVRSILSVSWMERHGFKVILGGGRSAITHAQGVEILVRRSGGLYVVRGRMLRVADGARCARLMPVEAETPEVQQEADDVEVAQRPDAQQEASEGVLPRARGGDVPLEPLVRAVPEPRVPTDAEKLAHRMTHLLPAAWCDVCVESRGRDAPHTQALLEERLTEPLDEIPLAQLDYTVMAQACVLSLYVTSFRGGAATVVTAKGPIPFAVRWVCRRCESWGLNDLRLRTDKEHSVVALAVLVALALLGY